MQPNSGAMENSTAQRRLVKSPPELWAEVSSEDALARRLARFGDIRITRLEPETTVAWEGDRASGTVELEPSGWGTKVTLTAMAAEAPSEAGDAVPQPAPGPPPVAPPAAQEPRPSLLVRLLHRRHRAPDAFIAPAPDPGPPALGPEPPPPAPGPAPTPQHASEILADVLDGLGAAHHRPFSRD